MQALPATPNVVVAFLAVQAATFKVSTLALRLAVVRQAHKLAGFPSPTRSVDVGTVMQGIRRRHGTRPSKKAALMVGDVMAICSRLTARLGDPRIGKRGNPNYPVDGQPEVVLVVEGDSIEGGESIIVDVHMRKYDLAAVGMKGGAEIRVRRKTAWLSKLGPMGSGFPTGRTHGSDNIAVRLFSRESSTTPARAMCRARLQGAP